MIIDRAKTIQPYDVGPGGRFWLQQLALGTILENPNGLGPFEFDRINGLQQHNVYMQGFLVYGWLGGAAYLALVAITLLLGLLHGLGADAMAVLSDRRLRGVRRRGLRRVDRRHRSLAPLLSRARNGLGTGGGDDQFPPPAGLGA